MHDDPVPWLLERPDPAVRALARHSLPDRGPRDAEWREAQARAMTAPPLGRPRPLRGPHAVRIDASKWVTLQATTILKHAFPG